MTLRQLADALDAAAAQLTEREVKAHLAPLLDNNHLAELAGLHLRMRTALVRVGEALRAAKQT